MNYGIIEIKKKIAKPSLKASIINFNGTKYNKINTLKKPILLAFSRKQRLHKYNPYFLIKPLLLLHIRLYK